MHLESLTLTCCSVLTNVAIHLSFNNKIPTSYSVTTTTLPQLHSHHDLGLLLSDDLSWRNHYDHIASKAYGLLRHIFSSCYSIRAKKSLCNSCQITTNILFSTVESIPDQDTVILEKIQRQATKFILSDYVSDYKTRLLKLDLVPLM